MSWPKLGAMEHRALTSDRPGGTERFSGGADPGVSEPKDAKGPNGRNEHWESI